MHNHILADTIKLSSNHSFVYACVWCLLLTGKLVIYYSIILYFWTILIESRIPELPTGSGIAVLVQMPINRILLYWLSNNDAIIQIFW